MAEAPTLADRLRTLGLALLNATLLLAIVLVVSLILLAGRVQRLAETATGALDSVAEDARALAARTMPQVAETSARLEDLNNRIDAALAKGGDSGTAAELAGLRTDVQALTAEVKGLSDDLRVMGADGYQALIAAIQTALAETATRLGAALPQKGTE